MKKIKVGSREFSVEEKAEYNGYPLNTAKGSALGKPVLFKLGQRLGLPSEGEAGAKVPNAALRHLSVCEASQVYGQLIKESENKMPSATAIARAQRTLAKARGF